MKKWKVACVLIATSITLNTATVFADTLKEKQDSLDTINKDIKRTKDEINQFETNKSELIEQIAEIEIEIRDKEEQLCEVEKILAELQDSISEVRDELKDAEEKADKQKELMDKRLLAMYVNSHSSYLETLFGVRSFSEFLDRVVMIREIMTVDKELFDEMQFIKDEIEEKKETLEEQRDIEKGTKEDILQQKSQIEESYRVKEELIEKLAQGLEVKESDLNDLNKKSKELEAAIQGIIASRSATGLRGSIDVKGSAGQVINLATSLQGKPYVYGASGPSSFDCSGFTSYVYGRFGASIPRTAAGQANSSIGTKITSHSELQPGDLVFFTNSRGESRPVHHTGIYIGGGNFIHASSSQKSRKVTINTLNSGYYKDGFCWGRRLLR